MAERKPFLLRLDPNIFAAVQRWAADDLRSVNGQIEFLLRRSLRDAGRTSQRDGTAPRSTAAPGPAASSGPTAGPRPPDATA